MIRPVLIQAPAKFYEVVPIFCKEARKNGNLNKFYIWTDHKDPYGLDDDCVVVQSKDGQFSKNMRSLLSKVEEDQFYIFCEDHIIKSSTDKEGMEKDWRFAYENDDVGFLRLSYGEKAKPTMTESGYLKIPKKYRYYVSLQPAIWKREHFERCIVGNDDSWKFEINASKLMSKRNDKSSYMVPADQSLVFTNFYREGKYYRRQFVDYAEDNGIKLSHDWPVYRGKRLTTKESYLEERRKNNENISQ